MSKLGEIIDTLAGLPGDMVFLQGFTHADAYRGYYDQLAFEPAMNTRASDMLADALGAASLKCDLPGRGELPPGGPGGHVKYLDEMLRERCIVCLERWPCKESIHER